MREAGFGAGFLIVNEVCNEQIGASAVQSRVGQIETVNQNDRYLYTVQNG